jgi:hypothetical protein
MPGPSCSGGMGLDYLLRPLFCFRSKNLHRSPLWTTLLYVAVQFGRRDFTLALWANSPPGFRRSFGSPLFPGRSHACRSPLECLQFRGLQVRSKSAHKVVHIDGLRPKNQFALSATTITRVRVPTIICDRAAHDDVKLASQPFPGFRGNRQGLLFTNPLPDTLAAVTDRSRH